MSRKTRDPIIAGEDCELNGVSIGWNQRLEVEEDVQSFRILSLTQLAKFLFDFHKALKDLQIESIRALKNYQRSPELADNRKLWTGVQRELEKLLLDDPIKGDFYRIQIQPPFILCLKALLNHLGKEWAGR